MDPTACWRDLLLAVAERRTDEARSHADDLLVWFDRGGFPPTDWDPTLVRRFCWWVRGKRLPGEQQPAPANPPEFWD